jgi:hypothetical protein
MPCRLIVCCFIDNKFIDSSDLQQLNIRKALTRTSEESLFEDTGVAAIHTVTRGTRNSMAINTEPRLGLAELRGIEPKPRFLTPLHESDDV